MSAATTWAYQAPYRPSGYENQCYYRTDAASGHSIRIANRSAETPELQVFRWSENSCADIKVSVGKATVEVQLDRAALLALRDAINDVLQDGDEVEADRERRESFEAIQEELSMLEDGQPPGVYYAHPDVHYVHPDQVAAKVRELEASGAKRYLVMPDPVLASERQVEGVGA